MLPAFFALPAQGMNSPTSNTNTSNSQRSEVTKGVVKTRSVRKRVGSVARCTKEDEQKQSKVTLRDAHLAAAAHPTDLEEGETKNEAQSDSENLALRFNIYETSQKDVAHILASWDRVQGILLFPLNHEDARHPAEEQPQHASSPRSWRDREKEHQERLEKEHLAKLKALEDARIPQLEGEGAKGSARGQGVGVPCLDIQVLGSEDMTRKILESSELPAAEQVEPCEARRLSLPCSWAPVQATDDVPQWLRSSPMAGEVLTIPQVGGKQECSLYKHPVC